MIYLYHLIQDSRVMYVGLTKNIEARKSHHAKTKPSHEFIIVDSFERPEDAILAEMTAVTLYDTYKRFDGWNLSLGGEYDNLPGFNRKGIGGVKKGHIPWNKGVKGCFSDERIVKWKESRRGKVHSRRKLNESDQQKFLEFYKSRPIIDGVGVIAKNGRTLTYERLFAKKYHQEFNITETWAYNLVKRHVQDK